MAKLIGKVLIAQGGGPTAVINQSLVGAVLESRKFPEVTRVYGATNGVRGIIDEEFLDLSQETTHNLEQVADRPPPARSFPPGTSRTMNTAGRCSRYARRTTFATSSTLAATTAQTRFGS